MLEHDPDAEQPHEQMIRDGACPVHSRYDYDLRIGDAERDATMAQLREHFAAGRLTFDELTERIDLTLAAKTQGQIDERDGRPAAAAQRPGRGDRTQHGSTTTRAGSWCWRCCCSCWRPGC